MTDATGMFDPLPARQLNGHAAGHSPAPATPEWCPITPVPDDAPRTFPPHRLGQPSAVWDYHDTAGSLHMRVCRWDHDEGDKTILPLAYCEDDAGRRSWRWQQLPTPRPLYGLDRLADRPDSPVLVVEGEKTADAAAKVFPNHVVITSSGGSNAAGKADWSQLAGRPAVIWPDHDGPGRKYAADVARLATKAGAVSARVVVVPRAWPDRWDLADKPPDGVTTETLRAMLDGAVESLSSEAAASAPIDLKEAGLTQREALLQVCDDATVWRSTEGEAFVTVPMNRHFEHHAVASRAFRHWMQYRLARRYTQNGRPASANDNAIRDARAVVEARALIEGTMHPVALRIVEHEGAICIDLGTANWSVVKISVNGWSIVPKAPAPILRSKRTAPFTMPAARGDFGPLRRLLVHLDDDTFTLLVAWCLGALLPHGPYPILVLGGEHGSGKSTLARLMQRIAD
jgi:putative DNA primase/helicase